MDTVKIEKGNARLIAHRGASALEQENTCAAFLAAANRSYFGIETDLRVTADGYFVTCHDADLKRVAGVDLVIEEAALAEIQAVPLLDKDGVSHRSDLRVPQLCDYIRICRRYEKEAVLELKSKLSPGQVASVVSAIAGLGWLDRTTFISLHPENLVGLRHFAPEARAQFIPSENSDWLLGFLLKNRFGIDVYHKALTREIVEAAHAAGLAVNCWTVDTPEDAAHALSLGVDFITTNVLE